MMIPFSVSGVRGKLLRQRSDRRRVLALFASLALAAWHPNSAAAITAVEANDARFQSDEHTRSQIRASIVKIQVLLARRSISPGEIDGVDGENFRKAISEFRRQQSLPSGDELDQTVWDALHADDADKPVVSDYTITEQDAAYPFVGTIPKDYAAQAKLKKLGFRNPDEMLGEHFHMSEDLLKALNPKTDFSKPGQHIFVVEPSPPSRKQTKAARIVADKAHGLVIAYDQADQIMAAYPATIGSDEAPSPSGEVSVTRIAKNPAYEYDPEKNFQQGHNKAKLKLPPGPNNPVGSVWIALSRPTYGIHGTPEPSKVSKTESHGCVRLTNWDAEELAGLVRRGTKVRFAD
jgi:lipoprotein-anchoring transpeptidase ErfK/SrfK